MRTFFRVACTALGLTEIYAFLLLAPLLAPRHMAVYHWTGPAHTLFLPIFLDLAALWITWTLLLYAARHCTAQILLWSAIVVITPWVARTEWLLLGRTPPRPAILDLLYAATALCLLAAAIWSRSISLPFRWAMEFTSTTVFFFGLGGVLPLAQLTWFAAQSHGLNHPVSLHQSRPTLAKPRILWIVFDELSYQQIYERPYPGLQLPAFAALAAQSTVFTHAVPAGFFTDIVLPSFMSGIPLESVQSSPAGQLSIHPTGNAQWSPFDPHQTIFQDALNAGYSTAVAGWYLPYCRLLPTVLDRCTSSYDIPGYSGMSPALTLRANMLRPLIKVATTALPLRFTPAFLSHAVIPAATLHRADYENLTRAAEALLDDRSATFVLLHLPIPHLGGIYNRSTGHFTTGPSTYLDNLALADACLAALRLKLEQTGQWNSTTILLMGDHSWRTAYIVSQGTARSTEENIASQGGAFDDRPAYLVKLANQQERASIDQPFAAMRTRSLLKALMHGEIETPDQLAVWSQRQP